MAGGLRFSDEEFVKLKQLLTVYEWALSTLMTKLNIIRDDLHKFQNNNSIDYIASRIKGAESIAEKLHRLDLEITAENTRHLRDIAGIRIICPFAKDVFDLAAMLKTMPDINVVQEKDFVNNPKPGGYRSYHLIIEVPVFFSGKTENVPVEVQIRTEAMNFWATLEHRARYKYRGCIPESLSDELAGIADEINVLDKRMFSIHQRIWEQMP